jgi:hypothetical protein
MNPEQKLDLALQKVEDLFADQCEHGEQSRGLPQNCAACGQFIGPTAKVKAQRGLHGTAAALRVLAEANSAPRTELVPKLVSYVQHRDKLAIELPELGPPDRTFGDDQVNVIKLSEVLYALSFIKAGQGDTELLVHEIATKLLKAQIEKKGWSYFLHGEETVDPLPTAFAVLALCKHGYEPQIGSQVAFLKSETLNTARRKTNNINEVSVRIFCIFALTFRQDDLAQLELKELRRAFIEIWDAHKMVLGQPIEQGIEYSKGAINYYLRIPWQLYLLALAARLDPRRISGFVAQQKLADIVDAVLSEGFYYPYSGGPLSSRTNGILFDVLQKVRRFNKRNLAHRIYYSYDAVRTFLSHRIFAWITLAAWGLIFSYSIYAWVANAWSPKDLGSSMASRVIILFITFTFERLRKSK